MKWVNREASDGEVRFWTVVVGVTWASLFALLALHLAGVL